MSLCTCLHMCICLYVCVSMCAHMYLCLCVHVSLCVCKHTGQGRRYRLEWGYAVCCLSTDMFPANTHTHTHTHNTHTHTHTHTHTLLILATKLSDTPGYLPHPVFQHKYAKAGPTQGPWAQIFPWHKDPPLWLKNEFVNIRKTCSEITLKTVNRHSWKGCTLCHNKVPQGRLCSQGSDVRTLPTPASISFITAESFGLIFNDIYFFLN